MPSPINQPTSRLSLLAASLAAPLAILVKLIPSTSGAESASAALLRLSTGGVIDSPWGLYLVCGVQIVLGLGLLIPRSRALAGLGFLLYAVAVVLGMIMHWSVLITDGNLNSTGVALFLLLVVLLAGAAFGTRGAAKRVGAAE